MEKFSNIPERVIGQCWDSVAPSSKTIVAIPFALFPSNKFLQSIVRGILKLHLTLYRRLQWHYRTALDNYLNTMIKAPALVFASKIDPIGVTEYAQEITDHWRNRGIDVVYKCFDDSPHIKHFQKYPDEYLKHLHEHWDKIKLLERK